MRELRGCLKFLHSSSFIVLLMGVPPLLVGLCLSTASELGWKEISIHCALKIRVTT